MDRRSQTFSNLLKMYDCTYVINTLPWYWDSSQVRIKSLENHSLFRIQLKVVYPQSLSLEVGTFNEVAPALNSLLELTNGGENYTIKAIFQWKLHRENFIVTIIILIFHFSSILQTAK